MGLREGQRQRESTSARNLADSSSCLSPGMVWDLRDGGGFLVVMCPLFSVSAQRERLAMSQP